MVILESSIPGVNHRTLNHSCTRWTPVNRSSRYGPLIGRVIYAVLALVELGLVFARTVYSTSTL